MRVHRVGDRDARHIPSSEAAMRLRELAAVAFTATSFVAINALVMLAFLIGG